MGRVGREAVRSSAAPRRTTGTSRYHDSGTLVIFKGNLPFRLVTAVGMLGIVSPAADSPAFRAKVALVKADVSVHDRHTHAPIAGLAASDFLVFDEDQPREIVSFGTESTP